MRLLLILIGLGLGSSYANSSYGQTKIDIAIKDASLIEFFEEIQASTEFVFFYKDDVLKDNLRISLNLEKASLEKVLQRAFSNTSLVYKISDKQVVVKRHAEKVNKQNKINSKNQQKTFTVTGTVTEAKTGMPVPAANILEKGTSNGVMTDFDGNYSIDVPEDAVLQVSYMGYVTKEIQINGRNEIDIVLQEDAAALDEVVVVGYGTQKKSNLTGAVSQIGSEDIALRPAGNISSSLQGLMPGLNIQVNSGDPAATPDINVRGFNSINGGGPLVLIDGIEGDITRVNPQDIEEVTVLKDAASAAIYGARGAFGVILITTKRGKAGELVVDYTNNFSWTTPTTRTDFVSDGYLYGKTVDAAIGGYNGSSFTGFDDMDWETMAMVSRGEIEPFHEQQPNGSYKFFYNTDWYDYLFKEWQPSTMHNVSISGGSDKVKGYLSGRVYERETIQNIQDADMNRYNLRSNLVFNPTDWLEVSNTTMFAHEQDKDFGGYRNGYGGVWSTTTWYDLMAFYPSHVDGIPTDVGRSGNGGQGGHAAMEGGNNWREFDVKELRNTFRVKVTPFEGLELNADYSNNVEHTSRTYRYNEFEYLTGSNLDFQTAGINQLGEWRWEDNYKALNVYGTYDVSFNDSHNFKLLLGYNQEEFDRDRIFAQQGNLLIRDLANLSLGTDVLAADGSALNWALQGYFGRFNYDYKSKYFLELNARYDGSSRFPEDSRWGLFPSVSAGWQMDREDFWKPIENAISSLKLRVSYGELGNQTVPVNTFQRLMGVGRLSWLNGGEPINYAASPNPLPRIVSWESTSTIDFGADIGFLNNRLLATFDWYEKNTDGMYLPGEPLPAVFGASEPRENLASLRNRGFELGVTYRDNFMLAGSELSFGATLNVSNSKGIITKYDNPEGLMSTYWEGQELGQIWGYRVNGQFQNDEEALAYQESFENPSNSLGNVYNYILNIVQNSDWNHLRAGDIKYLDLDGDGRIDRGNYTLEDHGDLVPIGNAMPKFPFGFNLNASWKDFDLSVAGAGVGQQHWYPTGDIYWGPYQRPYLSFLRKDLVTNAWSPENPSGTYPQIERGYASLNRGRSLYEMNDYYLKNIGYLRVKNLTFGYTLPSDLTERFEVRKLRMYFSGENLFTWTFGDLSGYIDPEQAGNAINFSNPGDAVGRADLRDYPMGKTFSLGVNISL